MDFKDLVQKRRSIRKFTDEPVSEDQLRTILRAGLMAPTGHGQRGWQFVVVDNRQVLTAISQCREAGSEFVKGAAVAIAVCYDTSVSDVWIEDASIAAVTMQYQATDLGLGSCWCQVRARSNAENVSASATIKQLLGLADNIEVECVLGIGHPAIERKLQDEEKLNWDCVKK
jgi:nitroreductase